MKKNRIILFIAGSMLLGSTFLTSKAVEVRAEDEVSEETTSEVIETSEEETPTYTCTVVLGESKHGTISTSANGGEVGDIITFTVTPSFFYVVDVVKVNGITLTAAEDGSYTFILAEGENKITVSYVVDPELAGQLSTIIDDVEAGDWTNVFSLENILLIINYVINSGLGIALVTLFKKYRYSKTVDRSDVVNTIKNVLPENAEKILGTLMTEQLLPLLGQITAKIGTLEEAMQVFTKVLALSQENTPEARIAILEALSAIKLGDQNAIDAAMTFIKEQLDAINKKYEENLALLEALKESNNKAIENSKAVVETVEKEETISDDGTQI